MPRTRGPPPRGRLAAACAACAARWMARVLAAELGHTQRAAAPRASLEVVLAREFSHTRSGREHFFMNDFYRATVALPSSKVELSAPEKT